MGMQRQTKNTIGEIVLTLIVAAEVERPVCSATVE
jgi:hypothetical protein